jgi:hypothetical protein
LPSNHEKNNDKSAGQPKAGLAKPDVALPYKSQPIPGVALPFTKKRAGFTCLHTEPAKSRVLLFDAS